MSDLDVLRELIKREASVSLVDTSYGKRTAMLTEPANTGTTGYSVTIKGIPQDAVVIKTDKFPSPDGIFSCRKGECRRADYVIVTNSDAGNYMLYIELKSGKRKFSRKYVTDQLRGAQCFMSYCGEIGRAFWQQPGFLRTRYKNRFVSIRKVGINKYQTKPEPQGGTNDQPDRHRKIPSNGALNFRKLVL